ncbi:MAG: hypothetical protein AAB427_12695 [Chloroflexota bacterium]
MYLRYGDTIAYNLRLLNAKRVADKFYAEYDGITKSIPYGSRAATRNGSSSADSRPGGTSPRWPCWTRSGCHDTATRRLNCAVTMALPSV